MLIRRKTLNNLINLNIRADSNMPAGRSETATIMKSKVFHPDLKNLNKDPSSNPYNNFD